MTQSWIIDATADNITFNEAPASGTNNVVIKEFAGGAFGGSTSLWAMGAWSNYYGYPSEVEYFGDRIYFACSWSQTQTIWGSRVSGYTDFGKSSPIQDDDAVTFTLNARQTNRIHDLIPLDSLVCMTSGGEWKVSGDSDNVITPSTVGFQPQSYRGSSKKQAVVVGNSVLYIQARGNVIRDLSFKFESDGYDGNDLSIFAQHLIEGHTIVDMAYQQWPNSVVWIVRSDGILLGLTYVREQEVVGWHWHETQGTVENVCCIAENEGDVIYLGVLRDGVRYIERLESRFQTTPYDSFFVDSGLTYDGRNTTTETLTVTGSGWTENDAVTITGSVDCFAATNVGDHVVVGGTRFRIAVYVSPTVVTGYSFGSIPVEIQGVATADWTLRVDTIGGLDHLNGKTVSILSDGNVIAPQVVSGGSISLSSPGGVVHVGLGYESDFETLEVNSVGQETIRDRMKAIPRVSVIVDKSKNIQCGPEFDRLELYRTRLDEDYESTSDWLTGIATIDVSTNWSTNGRICIRQDQPVPISILGVIPELKVGG